MKVYFIYTKYYDFDDDCLTVGGVQTYIQGLIPVFSSLGFISYIYQIGESNEVIKLRDGTTVKQIDTQRLKNRADKIQLVVSDIMKRFDNKKDFLIFLANEITCPNGAEKSIAIQHGISWDMLSETTRPEWRNKIGFAFKARRAYHIISKLKDVNQIVCVDHNFPNWLKATAVRFCVPMTVIPNFTQIAPAYKKPDNVVNIIFARRFFPYRGTRLFTEAIQKVLESYDNVYVTIAGSGPDEVYMKKALEKYEKKVMFTRYSAEDALSIHADKHIAVVPTLSSEGTSLSLLEAMSAQCATISTDIGGLSNIVIDGYNAIYSNPTPEDLTKKINDLIQNQEKRDRIGRNAYESVKYGFSYEIWANRWRDLILKMMG